MNAETAVPGDWLIRVGDDSDPFARGWMEARDYYTPPAEQPNPKYWALKTPPLGLGTMLVFRFLLAALASSWVASWWLFSPWWQVPIIVALCAGSPFVFFLFEEAFPRMPNASH